MGRGGARVENVSIRQCYRLYGNVPSSLSLTKNGMTSSRRGDLSRPAPDTTTSARSADTARVLSSSKDRDPVREISWVSNMASSFSFNGPWLQRMSEGGRKKEGGINLC